MRVNIFTKFLVAFFIASIVPLVVSNFLTISTYEEAINKYLTSEEPFPQEELALTYENAKYQVAVVALFIVVLVIFVSIIINRNLVRPLQRLTEGAEKISGGKLDTKVAIKTGDELEKLADSFNRMAEELKRSRDVLEEERASLEIKVRARTEALEEERGSLESKVQLRTRELQERVEELGKFQKLTVGRELKMVELKEEIERLKKEETKNKQ